MISRYQVLQSLGKGGMGEVLLVYDPVCGRNVALKQIRSEYVENKTMQDRFLREAKVAAKLSHPSIIAIYTINQDKERIYYTMPYVEGETLKTILRTTREQEKNGDALHPIGSSIVNLIRIFLSVCGAVAYAHSRGIIHRDLKPENIIVGKYGEVIILDWGLADYIQNPEHREELHQADLEQEDLTRPGAIPGTLSYMAPERAFGEPSSTQSDIYSLGVVLYQLLTLHLPFQRSSLKEFRKIAKHEQLIAPEEMAPDREISPFLSDIVKKILSPSKEMRYQTVEEMIADLEKYIEGLPEWIASATLLIENKNDWEFQENVLLAKHMAITRQTDVMEWVSLMVSKQTFPGSIKLETKISIGDSGNGVGFLLSVPENSPQKGLVDGYCLWIGSSAEVGTHLYRSHVEVMHFPEIYLPKNQLCHLRIEMIDHHLRLYIGSKLKMGYFSHLPLIGNHIGLLFRDADFNMEGLNVFMGSQNVMVNCLAVPNAFLARKHYTEALAEYRKIASSFPGRSEGREAIFHSGITLLEEAKTKVKKSEKQRLLSLALDEFEKLHGTPGAPLEYYGKSLVYKVSREMEEEAKCLELAIRKFPKHPLKPVLVEYIVSRLHESARSERLMAYQLALICLRHLSGIFSNREHQMLIDSLEKYLEPLFFFKPIKDVQLFLSIQLAFWLNKPLTLKEIFEQYPQEDVQLNCLHALLHLNQIDLVNEKIPSDFRALAYQFEKHLDGEKTEPILSQFSSLDRNDFSKEEWLHLEKFYFWALLLTDDREKLHSFISQISTEALEQETHPFFFLYGCFLYLTKGKEKCIEVFSTVTESPFPPTSLLLPNYLLGRIDLKNGWFRQAFFWEKLQLYRQLILFAYCSKNLILKQQMKKKLQQLFR